MNTNNKFVFFSRTTYKNIYLYLVFCISTDFFFSYMWKCFIKSNFFLLRLTFFYSIARTMNLGFRLVWVDLTQGTTTSWLWVFWKCIHPLLHQLFISKMNKIPATLIRVILRVTCINTCKVRTLPIIKEMLLLKTLFKKHLLRDYYVLGTLYCAGWLS